MAFSAVRLSSFLARSLSTELYQATFGIAVPLAPPDSNNGIAMQVRYFGLAKSYAAGANYAPAFRKKLLGTKARIRCAYPNRDQFSCSATRDSAVLYWGHPFMSCPPTAAVYDSGTAEQRSSWEGYLKSHRQSQVPACLAAENVAPPPAKSLFFNGIRFCAL